MAEQFSEAEILWQTARDLLLSKNPSFSMRQKSLFSDITAQDVTDSSISLIAPNNYVRTVLLQRYSDSIKDALSEVAYTPMEFDIILAPSDSPSADSSLEQSEGSQSPATPFKKLGVSDPKNASPHPAPSHMSSSDVSSLHNTSDLPHNTTSPTSTDYEDEEPETYTLSPSETSLLEEKMRSSSQDAPSSSSDTSPSASPLSSFSSQQKDTTDGTDSSFDGEISPHSSLNEENSTDTSSSDTSQASPTKLATDLTHFTPGKNPVPGGLSLEEHESLMKASAVDLSAQTLRSKNGGDSTSSAQQGGRVQRDKVSHLNKLATFDTFVPGESNRFAKAAAFSVAEAPGESYNPLFIYGSSGLGKTHLLNAVGNYAQKVFRGITVRYVSSEEFTNEFIEAVKAGAGSDGQVAEFNRRYRSVDILLIDDIQFLSGKTGTMETFFHTFNALYNARKQIVVASDVAPRYLQNFEKRLISRFEMGLSVDVQPPNQETRIAILRMKAAITKPGAEIPSEVIDLIAQQVTDNIRELEGALIRVLAMASLNNQPITLPLAEQTLKDYFVHSVVVTPTDIIGVAADYFDLTFEDLVSPNRSKKIALARQVAMYLCREMTTLSLTNIGETFGGRDHSTVMHACQKISSEMAEKREVYTYVTELSRTLKSRHAVGDKKN